MTTEDKAQALVDAVYAGRHRLSADTRFIDRRVDTDEALCRAIEQHEEDKAAHVDQLLVMDALTTTAETQREAAKQELNDFKQKVSDVVYRSLTSIAKGCAADAAGDLSRFIIPAPKPDPLLAAMNEVIKTADVVRANADQLRAALDALGFEIREKGQ